MSSGRAPNSIGNALLQEADQLSMFGADASPEEVDALRGADGRLPSDAFRRLRAANATRGPGRPLGAVNKRSERLAAEVIHRFGDPVLGGASLYAMPLDQLCEMLLVADGTQEREERMEELTGALSAQVNELAKAVSVAARSGQADQLGDAASKLADAAESLEQLGKTRGRAGALALQALNLQLAARKFVGEYVHAKRPVAVDMTVKRDGVLVMPGAAIDSAAPAFVQQALDAGLRSGKLDADMVGRLEFHNNRLIDPEGEVEDADFAPIDGGDGDDA